MSSTLLWALIIALTVLVVGQGLAFLELVRQFAQLRERLHMDDRPIGHPADTEVIVSLPARVPPGPLRDAVAAELAAVVLLSDSCLTCRNVAKHWSRLAPLAARGLEPVTVLSAQGEQEAARFLAGTELPRESLVLDPTGELSVLIGQQAGLRTRPAVLILEYGRLRSIDVVQTTGQLAAVLDTALAEAGTHRTVQSTTA